MRQLVWSDELARIAQTWADQCDCVFQENQVRANEKKDKSFVKTPEVKASIIFEEKNNDGVLSESKGGTSQN